MRKILGAFILLVALPVYSAIDLGASTTSSTAGRLVPGLAGAYYGDWYVLSGFSSGGATPLYYTSSYYLSFTWSGFASEFWWAGIRGNFGGAIYYSERGYREDITADLEKASDFAIGPSIRIVWDFMGPVYLCLEGMYGLRNPMAHVMLSFQDVEMLSIGIHL